jgi:hypothetical protein
MPAHTRADGTEKIAYGSQHIADNWAWYWTWKKGVPTHSYRCADCGLWHLSTTEAASSRPT